jgi:hypothetical protein
MDEFCLVFYSEWMETKAPMLDTHKCTTTQHNTQGEPKYLSAELIITPIALHSFKHTSTSTSNFEPIFSAPQPLRIQIIPLGDTHRPAGATHFLCPSPIINNGHNETWQLHTHTHTHTRIKLRVSEVFLLLLSCEDSVQFTSWDEVTSKGLLKEEQNKRGSLPNL